MIPTIIISVITFLSITLSLLFFPKIKIGRIKIQTFWLIALTGAVILMSTNLAPAKEIWAQLTSKSPVNPLKIIVLFFSMTFISIFLDCLGLFRYLAMLAAKKAKNNQFVLFLIFYLLTATLTIFTSNDVVILTLTPFICFFCRDEKINPIPYLVAEFAAANTWSLMFIIGNPTNIYLATSAGINFLSYFKVMALPTLAAGIVELGLLLLLFKNKLKQPLSGEYDDFHFHDKVSMIIGLIHLFVCLIFLIISNYINVEMWLIAAICAGSLLVCMFILWLINRHERKYYFKWCFKRLPYSIIPFFLSMFVIVVALNYQGISQKIAEFLGSSYTIATYGTASFLACNLINNIPMSILFSNLCSNLPETSYLSGIFSTIIGSNIGAFLTPIGALAGIMFTALVNRLDVKYTFSTFVLNGVIVSIPVLVAALATLIGTIDFI